jgi:hypothetical protein
VEGAARRIAPDENLIWSLVPSHLGMRQYWRDLDRLERWTRSGPHGSAVVGPLIARSELYPEAATQRP